MNTQALLTLVMALLAVLLLLSFPLVSLLTRQVKRQRKKRMNIVVTSLVSRRAILLTASLRSLRVE